MTVKALLKSADAEKINEWMAFFDLEDPELAAWQRTSLLASVTTNMASLRGRQKYPGEVKSDHFVPKKRPRVQTPQQQLDTFKALFPK